MQLLIRLGGVVSCIYDEAIDLHRLGQLSIRRASHVEPDDRGRWHVDVLTGGPHRLGPFAHRSAALQAELAWLERHLLGLAE